MKKKIYNIFLMSKKEKIFMSINLIASGVVFKERNKIDVLAEAIEQQQKPELQLLFKKRLIYYRKISKKFLNKM